MSAARRASLPEGKSLFFRRSSGEDEVPPVEEVPAPPAAAVPAPARAPKAATRQSAIFLEERHLDWLEDKCREARQRGGRAIRKALIIRALLDVAMESPVDLTSLHQEDELLERLRKGLREGSA
jgi:hypothetical protein